MKWLAWISMVACLLTATVVRAEEDETAFKATLRAVVAVGWRGQDMREVERLSQEFRASRARALSGAWKSRLLHGVLREEIDQAISRGEGWASLREKSARWARESRDAPVAELFHADVIVRQAWSIRGHEYANKVSAANMQAFGQLIGQASVYLQSVKKTAAIDPEWYALMLDCFVLSGASTENVWAMLAEATTREPGYMPTYYAAMERFSPKWGGSEAELENFIQRAAPLAGDRQEETYARLYARVIQLHALSHFASSKADCHRVVRGMQAFLAGYPDSFNVNMAARVAGACGDKEFALQLIGRIGDHPMADVWGKPPAIAFEGLKRWASQ